MKERNRLGYRIRRRREAMGLSKSEFSRQVGVTPTAVHNWEENGVVPRADMMLEIAKVLEVNASELSGRETEEDFVEDGPGPNETNLDLIDDYRRAIAQAYGVAPSKVQISIAL